MSDSQKILITSSIQLPEVEEDDDRDLVYNAEIRSDFLDVINNIGKGIKCRDIIYLTKDNILSQNVENLRIFSFNIFNKINDVYKYEPMNKFDVSSKKDFITILDFLNFLEFSCKDFIFIFLKESNLILEKKYDSFDIEFFNIKDIDNIIEKCISNLNINNEIILDFLRTYSKENIFKFLKIRLKDHLNEIILMSLLERRA